MAEDLVASGAVEVADGYRLGQVNTTIWPLYREDNCVSYRYPAAGGDIFTLYQERGEYQIQYGALDADGVEIWRPDGYQVPARPYSKTFTMPAGTAYVAVSWQRSAKSAAPTLVKVSGGGGSMSVLSSAQVTLSWSAGILTTVRYYQLASPTSATPAVPSSSSDLGSWTETEPEADATKVLWTCERTVYADGTESWSKASKSTSYEAAKDAKSTATDAQQRAVALSTLVRETDAGVEVGKTADGTTYATGRTLQTADAFKVLDKAGNVLSSFGANLIELGKNSVDAAIRMLGGLATMEATKLNDVTGLLIASDAVDVVASGGGGARLFSSFGKVSNHTAVWSALASELPTLYAECTDLPANGEEVVTNKVAMTPMGFELSRPDAMRSALGLGFTQLYYDYDAGWVVYASDYLVWIYAWGVAIGSGSWDSKTCPYVLPEKYRPRLSHITTPTSVNNGGSWTSVMSVNSQGQISVKNYGNAGSTDARYGVLLYPVGV